MEGMLLVVFIVVVELSSGAASEGGVVRCIHRSCSESIAGDRGGGAARCIHRSC